MLWLVIVLIVLGVILHLLSDQISPQMMKLIYVVIIIGVAINLLMYFNVWNKI